MKNTDYTNVCAIMLTISVRSEWDRTGGGGRRVEGHWGFNREIRVLAESQPPLLPTPPAPLKLQRPGGIQPRSPVLRGLRPNPSHEGRLSYNVRAQAPPKPP